MGRRRVVCVITAAAMLVSTGHLWAVEVPRGFTATYDELARLVDTEGAGPLEVARGTYLASSFFAVGSPGLPATRTWFRQAGTRGRAAVATMFLASHGTVEDHRDVRHHLETDRAKRAWLFEIVGTPRNTVLAMQDGQTWKPVLRVLPVAAGCSALGGRLMESRDPLVRRAGLYVGYWFATPGYWNVVQALARSDTDALVRWMAELLIRTERSRASRR